MPQPIRLTVAYDGTDFRGFAAQADPTVRTIGRVLNGVLSTVLRTPTEVVCAGRTDAGVHARGQVVSFDADAATDLVRLQRSVNSMLGPEIVVRDAQFAPIGFSARFDAQWRRYRYTIRSGAVPDPFTARFAWHVPKPLDLGAMQLAADVFVGEHDFASFCRKDQVGSSMVRRVFEATIERDGDDRLVFDITANAFCWQMVRSIVGMIVDAGTGRRRPGDFLAILRAKDRALASQPAPPHGLTLWEVGY